jgi:galactokinase
VHCFFTSEHVNLIGEHTDYNGSHVFACDLNFGSHVIAKIRSDNLVRLYSKNFESSGVIEFFWTDEGETK